MSGSIMDRLSSRRANLFAAAGALMVFAAGAFKFLRDGWIPALRGVGDFWGWFPTAYLAQLRPDFPVPHVWSGWYYGPMVHFLTLPLLLVPRWSMMPLVWALINLAVVAATFVVSWRMASFDAGPGRRWSWPVATTLAGLWLFFLPLRNCFAQGNIEVLQLGLMAGGAYAVLRSREERAGVWFGLATLMKYLPVVFLGLLVVHRRWRGVRAGVLTIAAIAAVTAVTLRWENSDLLHMQRTERFRGAVPQSNVSTVSITSMFLHAAGLLIVDPKVDFPGDYEILRIKWFPSTRERTAALAGEVATVLLIAGYAVVFLIRGRRPVTASELSVYFMATILLAPWNQEYYYVFALVPFSILFLRSIAERRYGLLTVTLAAYVLISPPISFGWIDRAQWFQAPFAYLVNYISLPVIGGLLIWMTSAHLMFADSPGAPHEARRLAGARALKVVVPALVALGLVLMWFSRPGQAASSTETLDLQPPVLSSGPPALAISRDGSRVAYIASVNGDRVVCSRGSAASTAKCRTDGVDAAAPFFSPDGNWIGFFADGALKKVPFDGGPAEDVASAAGGGNSGTWTDADTIVYANGRAIHEIPAAGRNNDLVLAGGSESRYSTPVMLPSGETLLFTMAEPGEAAGAGTIVSLSLTTGRLSRLLPGTQPYFDRVTGRLIYALGGRVLAAPFDPQSLTITGVSVPLVENVLVTADGGAQFAVSRSGRIVYLPSTSQPAIRRSLMWVDRQGNAVPLPIPTNGFESPRLSPDGHTVAVVIRDVATDIWTFDVGSSAATRLTRGENRHDTPVWRPDGRAISFSVPAWAPEGRFTDWPELRLVVWPFGVPGETPPSPAVLSAEVGHGRTPELVWQAGRADSRRAPIHLSSWSRDGRVLLGEQSDSLWLLDPSKPVAPASSDLNGAVQPSWSRALIVQTPSHEQNPVISPDGRWIAYASDKSGQIEVYVQPFPALGEPLRVSNASGREPLWAPDGHELFYREIDRVMVVKVTTAPAFTATEPRGLFRGRYLGIDRLRNYDVAPDGQHFLMVRPEPPSVSSSLRVLSAWSARLSR